MKIAIISDIHDRDTQLLCALHLAKDAGCETLLCLGDIASTSSLRLMRENWDGTLHFVFGNNDWQRNEYSKMADKWNNTTCHGNEACIELDGRKLYLTHYPEMAARRAQEGLFDALFYGHTHRAEQHYEQQGNKRILIANPGELEGRTGHCSYAIYESTDNSLQHISVP